MIYSLNPPSEGSTPSYRLNKKYFSSSPTPVPHPCLLFLHKPLLNPHPGLGPAIVLTWHHALLFLTLNISLTMCSTPVFQVRLESHDERHRISPVHAYISSVPGVNTPVTQTVALNSAPHSKGPALLWRSDWFRIWSRKCASWAWIIFHEKARKRSKMIEVILKRSQL